MTFSTELEQKNLKICGRQKRSQVAKAILKKKYIAGRIKLPDFRQYYRASYQTAFPTLYNFASFKTD